MTKVCTGCHLDKPLENFGPDSRNRDGKKSRCRSCHCRTQKEIYRRRSRENRPCVKKKTCVGCETEKSALDFWRDKGRSDGLQTFCKNCKSRLRREYHLLVNFGMNQANYEDMLERQGNKCAICPKSFSTENKACVDHDHRSSKVRGLLCSQCNVGLGMFEDNIEVLQRAEKYLANREVRACS